jgi:hypothetical protein
MISSSGARSLTNDGMGLIWWLSSVAPVVLSPTNELHGHVSVIFPSTDTIEMQSNSSPNAASSNWFRRADTMGDDHPLANAK